MISHGSMRRRVLTHLSTMLLLPFGLFLITIVVTNQDQTMIPTARRIVPKEIKYVAIAVLVKSAIRIIPATGVPTTRSVTPLGVFTVVSLALLVPNQSRYTMIRTIRRVARRMPLVPTVRSPVICVTGAPTTTPVTPSVPCTAAYRASIATTIPTVNAPSPSLTPWTLPGSDSGRCWRFGPARAFLWPVRPADVASAAASRAPMMIWPTWQRPHPSHRCRTHRYHPVNRTKRNRLWILS
jgi:hypothetical protein